MIRLELTAKPVLEAASELLVIPIYSDVLPIKGFMGELDWGFNGQISRLYKSKRITGSPGDKALIPTAGKLPFPKLLLLGLGPVSGLNSQKISSVYHDLYGTMACMRASDATLMGFSSGMRGYNRTLFVISMMEGLIKGMSEGTDRITLSKIRISEEGPEERERMKEHLQSLISKHSDRLKLSLQVV